MPPSLNPMIRWSCDRCRSQQHHLMGSFSAFRETFAGEAFTFFLTLSKCHSINSAVAISTRNISMHTVDDL